MIESVVSFLSHLPVFLLVILFLIEASLAVLFAQLMQNESAPRAPARRGEAMPRQAADTYKAVFQIVERRLNELTSRCDMQEKKIVQLEARVAQADRRQDTGVESRLHELQKVVGAIVDKMKDFR